MGWQLMRVTGESMTPSLQPGELVCVKTGAYRFQEPQRGDIVAVRPFPLGGKAVVKRVVGLPYERVRVFERSWELRDGQYFLLSDRLADSLDSRTFGPVDRQELIGPIRTSLWPWKRHCSIDESRCIKSRTERKRDSSDHRSA
jgi:signal peptidase I